MNGFRQVCLAASVSISVAALAATLPALPLHPVDVRVGFEKTMPPVTMWASNGEAKVHTLAPTTEKAAEGTKSLKLDATLEQGTYHYWGAPLRAVCEGELELSARVYLDPSSSPGVSVGFGCNMVYPPTRHSGCGPFERITRQQAGKWVTAKANLVERGSIGKEAVLQRYTVNVTGENAGAILDRWSLFVYGKPGDHVVVYLDDIRLQGKTPAETAYTAALEANFNEIRAAFRKRVQGWRKQYEKAVAGLADITFPAGMKQHEQLLHEILQRTDKTLKKLAKQDYARPHTIESLERDVTTLEHAPATLHRLEAQLRGGVPFAVFVIDNPIVNTRVSPDMPPLDGRFGEPLRLAACPGEIESGSLGVYAAKPVSSLSVTATPLRGGNHTIPASALDIKILLWWYQGKGDSIGYTPKKAFKAELLVKDAALIRVDRKRRENFLRSTAADGSQRYVPCSTKDSSVLKDVQPRDADTLQPVSIPAGTVREFWVDVHVPDDTPPGLYRGSLRLETAAGRQQTVPVEVTVYGFQLKPSRLIYSIYYRAKLSPDGKPTITSEWRSEEQYLAEMVDMKDHGVWYPSNYQGWGEDGAPVRRVLDLRRRAGLPTGPFFNLGRSTGNTSDPAQLETLRRDVRKWRKLTREYGYTETYFYGIDEAKGDRLASQRLTWKAVQDASGKTFVACYKHTFEAMGKLLDCAVLAGPPDPAEAVKWHSVGSLAFCYAFPQVGVEAPEIYRRNFGLVLWKAGFDGAMDYAYQHGFGHVWNDFDDTRYRDHNFTYPTVNGVVDTIAWEGFREAVDDVRYVTTLEAAIRAAPPARRTLAREAEAWLAALDPRQADLAAVRKGMADWIGKLVVPGK